MRAIATFPAQISPFVARTAAGFAGTIGLAVVAGWTFEIPALKSVAPGFIAMQPWTAIAILVAAGALWAAASSTPAVRAASAIPAIALFAIVGLPLLEYATGLDPGTDLWLFPSAVRGAQTLAYPDPGRMSPLTSISLLALAGALALAPRVTGRAGRGLFSALASVGLLVTLMSVLAYILRLESLDDAVLRNPIAIPTALALAALSLGALALRPEAGWVGVVARQGSPGWTAAGLLVAATMLLVFGAEAAVTSGMVARAVAQADLRLETLRATLADAETGERGYLLTGRDVYLQPFEAARARLPGDLAAAEASLALIDGAPELSRLRELVAAKMAGMEETIALRRAGDAPGALARVESDKGKARMDAIRAMIDDFFAARKAAGGANGARAELAAALAALGAVGLTALALWALIAAGRVRREASETIDESRARQAELLATLSLGAFMARDSSGVIRYWAEGCVRLYGWSAKEAVGQSARDLLGTIYPVPEAEIAAVLAAAGEWTGDLRQRTRDGRELRVTAHKVMRHGAATERAVVLEFLTDVTALRRTEAALAESRALMQTVIETTPGLIYAKDRDGRMIMSNTPVAALVDAPPGRLAGRTDMEFLDDAAQAEAIMRNDRQVMASGVSQEFEELAGEADGQPRVWLSTKSPLRDPAGQVIGIVGVSIEITARKQAEDRLRLMVDELSHRVKNTLVTVQSIAAHTLRGADPMVYQVLEGRLQALAAVHDVLTGESWKDAGLNEVIESTLAPFAAGGAAQLAIAGPLIRLQPRVAVTLAIALHELATNAIKYGAWSDASGQVRVAWEIAPGPAPKLRMTWSEERGPRVEAPTVRGFGSRMIERSLAHDLGGTAQIAFHATGLVCTIEAPLAEIAAKARAIPLPRVGALSGTGAWR